MGLHIGHMEHGSSGDPAVPVSGYDGRITYVPASQANQFYEMQSELPPDPSDDQNIQMASIKQSFLCRIISWLKK